MVPRPHRSLNLTLRDRMPLRYGLAVKSPGVQIPDMLPLLMSGRLLAVLQFHSLLKTKAPIL